ncbi:hypothetical protein F5X68DRAFT_77259 [Plectosphaerella plurivora]|uniref:Uncharacterized protein n=1 Tax=Plectosphaerella plurivora TaxID=936078 RepID=A0A9P8VG10_9PEZI|nr:hypothetical protein F5X68DRAFT_77259 [Plectosphaerella plurivora]
MRQSTFWTLFLPLLAASQNLDSIPSPLICRDTLDGSPPFRDNNIPCLLGCLSPVTVPTDGLLPGMINSTAIPYCRLDCVHREATPEQSSRAPDCNAGCETSNAATPENLGWCMYWCVNGFGDFVHSTTCIPGLVYGDPTISVIPPDITVTLRLFTQPPEFGAWLETQAILSTQVMPTAAPQTSFQDDSRGSTTTSSSSATPMPETSTSSTTVELTTRNTPESTASTSSPDASGQGQAGAVESEPNDNENRASLLAGLFAWPILLTGAALMSGLLL